ncbi:hypothetical protein Nepgr_010867 [Nepenthes gracilis]|uniref:LOB domain-containing protein n=1 Tax=Nepenthes gracilis TaxID=150966 RepID=A0AAD3XLF9_NEPGR|nr:hypothetical protein Nepgr_010867 [Nepenthes gracilis]
MVQQLPVHLRAEAAECMSFEATSRIRDPIYGCAGIITQLQHQIIQAKREVAKIQAKITFYSAQVHVDPACLTQSHYAQKQECTLQTSISNPSFGESRGGEFDDGPF